MAETPAPADNTREAFAVALVLRPRTIDLLQVLAIQQKTDVNLLISAILDQYAKRIEVAT